MITVLPESMMKLSNTRIVDCSRTNRGFTLVEMLVAMAVTLIMMAALARSFGFVGSQVRDGRADMQLSNQLRDVSTRLSDELSAATVTLKPADSSYEPNGYFMYYEGPVTDATSSIFRAQGSGESLTIDGAKYGDFDDYLAFTAVAKGGDWFVGKVPRYILDMKTAELAGDVYTLPADGSGFDPVVIRSKYAEIVYFASPEYSPTSLPASPSYIDVDGDVDLGSGSAIENGLPDRLRIHRRVLLIRPDLNISFPDPSDATRTIDALPVQTLGSVPFMQADTWPTASTATVVTGATAADGWLYGMAGVHQQCDLSVRRIYTAAGSPSINVAANSIADLAKPHNRFAHVRIPNSVLIGSGGASFPTSMPVLALGNAATILSAVTSTASVALIAPPATPSAGPVVTPATISGFIRPEFVLGNDYTHLDSNTDLWGRERIGEDLLVNNALSFDIQVYDSSATFVDTSRFDTGATNVIVGPSDAGYRDAIVGTIAQITTYNAGPPVPAVLKSFANYSERGGYVDLCYPVLAGGSLRGWQARRLDRRQNADSGTIGKLGNVLISPASGIRDYEATDTVPEVYQPSLFKSGKLVTLGTTIRLFQPTYDTFTNSYERDGFFQTELSASSSGKVWSSLAGSVTTDFGSNGLDDDGVFGVDDFGEQESSAPFINKPDSVRVTFRLENPKTRQIRQASVVHRD